MATLRSGRFGFLSVILVAITVGVLGLPAPIVQAITSANAITYVYDDLGRLEAVVDPGQTNGLARYTYDGAGNLLSIARQSSSATTIVDFHPKLAKRDAKVTIYGAGFSATPGSNTVKFGGSSGTPATVLAATATQLVVDIPDSGTINGAIYVQSPTGSATSTQQFAEDTSAAPVITGFSPSIATTGTQVTITGTGFDPTSPAMNNVFVNGIRMQVTSATSTNLTAVIPPFLTSGQITVQTRAGQSTSSDDLFVPPANDGVPYPVSAVDSTGRTTLGTQTVVNVAAPQKVALRVFDGVEGGRVFVSFFSSGGAQAYLSLVDPFGRGMGTELMTTGYIDTETLPVTGSYQVVIDPIADQTGTFTFTVNDVPPDVTGSVTLDGPPVVANITSPGQNARYTFDGQANQRVSFGWVASGWTGNGYLRLLRPEGIEIMSKLILFGWQEPVVLPVSGTYTVVIDPIAGATGSTTLNAYDVPPDSSAPITPNGPAVNVTIATDNPGQNANLVFDSTGNQQATINITNSTFSQAYLHLYYGTPPSNPIATNQLFFTGSSTKGPFTLPQAGSYTIQIDPIDGRTGSADVALTLTGGGGAPQILPSGGRARETVSTDLPPVSGPTRGSTALAGNVLLLDGMPLEGVSVRIDDVSTTTDASGRFLLAGLPAGGQVLVVDGESASTSEVSTGCSRSTSTWSGVKRRSSRSPYG